MLLKLFAQELMQNMIIAKVNGTPICVHVVSYCYYVLSVLKNKVSTVVAHVVSHMIDSEFIS